MVIVASFKVKAHNLKVEGKTCQQTDIYQSQKKIQDNRSDLLGGEYIFISLRYTL